MFLLALKNLLTLNINLKTFPCRKNVSNCTDRSSKDLSPLSPRSLPQSVSKAIKTKNERKFARERKQIFQVLLRHHENFLSTLLTRALKNSISIFLIILAVIDSLLMSLMLATHVKWFIAFWINVCKRKRKVKGWERSICILNLIPQNSSFPSSFAHFLVFKLPQNDENYFQHKRDVLHHVTRYIVFNYRQTLIQLSLWW